MTKSNLLLLTGVGLLLSAGLVEACGSSTHFVDLPSDVAGAAGKVAHAGASSVAGDSSMAGDPSEPFSDGGAAGTSSGSEEAGEGGAPEVGGTGATGGVGLAGGGSGGTLGGAGGSLGGAGLGGSAGKTGSGGASVGGGGGVSGIGGNGGSAGKAGAGTGGGGSGGTAGTTSSAGSAGSAGAAGAGLVLPASSNCAAGNVQAAFSVCRNCHVTNGQGPFNLVTLADIQLNKDDIFVAIGGTAVAATMPLEGTLLPANKTIILNFISNGAMGVPNGTCQ